MSIITVQSSGLIHWANLQSWQIVDCEPIHGGHAASLVRVRFITDEGVDIRAVYKRFTANRTSEARLYPMIAPELIDYAPRWFGNVTHFDEFGIVLEDAGVPIKRWMEKNPADAGDRLVEVARWLATMHIRHEATAQRWLNSHDIGTYPFASTTTWWQQALEGLTWAQQQGLGDLTIQRLGEIRRMADWVEAQLPVIMSGRTTLTHGDPHLENILVNPRGLRLIDWEFACACLPQRDLAVLLQDVLDPASFSATKTAFLETLGDAGWDVDHLSFERAFDACLFDNTLMMIGWDIHNARAGILDAHALDTRLRTKLQWLRDSRERLSL